MATKKTVDGIRAYLDGLGASDKPLVDREAVKALKAQIRSETDSINRLKLLAELAREEVGKTADRSGDEAVFLAEAKAWAEGEDIPVSAFQALGVPDDVLKRAGFTVTAASAPARATRSSSGTRAPRLAIEDVEQAARSLPGEWRLADLAAKLDRDPTTTRNYLKKLMAAGTVTEIGDDPSHDGRGRAPKLYKTA